MILVIGHFAVDPARHGDFLDFARGLIKQERAAEGCISFDIFEDVTQPDEYLMMERWDSQAAFEHHADTPEADETDRIFETFLAGDPSFDTYEF
jgi:quinol monooxygenase YgiN